MGVPTSPRTDREAVRHEGRDATSGRQVCAARIYGGFRAGTSVAEGSAMASTTAAAFSNFGSLGFDEDDLESPPSTKRLDHRDLQAAVAVMGHVEDDCPAARTLMVSPEENKRLLEEAFADSSDVVAILSVRDDDLDIYDDITVERKAPLVALPAWVHEAKLDAAALELSPSSAPVSGMATRPSASLPPSFREMALEKRAENRTRHVLAAAWTVAAAALGGAAYLLAFMKP